LYKKGLFMNYSPYDPNNSHQYPTNQGQYPQSGANFSQPGQFGPTPIPKPTGLEAQFHQASGWVRWGLISLSGLVFIGAAIFLFVIIGSAMGLLPQPQVAATPTVVPTPTATPSPTPQSIHYPPTTVADLRGLAAKGDVNAIHEFHSESVGDAGVCPQPKKEVTVDPSVTGQQLAEDLLAYFYTQQLDSNPCGSVIFAYHNQAEVNDPNTGGTYTAGLINVDVTDSSGATNTDPNASGLKHKLTLDVGSLGTNQEYVITY
jgi:hypothetical protein